MSPAEIARIVAAVTRVELAADVEHRNGSEGVAHYRYDGTYVDEHGSVMYGMSRTAEFMPSTNNIFYGQNGKLKSYAEGWDAWASRYGKGQLGNTGFSSHDVYTGVYHGKEYYPHQAGLQKLFAISEIAAQQPGAEITTQDGKKLRITPEQIKGYIDRRDINDPEAQKIADDPRRSSEFVKGLYRETTVTNGKNPESIENKSAAETAAGKAAKLSGVIDNIPNFEAPKKDVKQSAAQAPAKAPSPAP